MCNLCKEWEIQTSSQWLCEYEVEYGIAVRKRIVEEIKLSNWSGVSRMIRQTIEERFQHNLEHRIGVLQLWEYPTTKKHCSFEFCLLRLMVYIDTSRDHHVWAWPHAQAVSQEDCCIEVPYCAGTSIVSTPLRTISDLSSVCSGRWFAWIPRGITMSKPDLMLLPSARTHFPQKFHEILSSVSNQICHKKILFNCSSPVPAAVLFFQDSRTESQVRNVRCRGLGSPSVQQN